MKEKSSYRILMFAPAFAPFANAEAIVNNKLALVMLEAGWKVDIISRDFVGASPYDYGSGWVEPWLPLREHTHEISYKLGGKLLRTLDIMRCVAKTFYPFDGCRWAARAYDRTISLLKKKRYDVILSRAFPEYAHLPAMKISQDTGILWIANWNDPRRFLRQRVITGSLKDNLGFFSSFFIKKIA